MFTEMPVSRAASSRPPVASRWVPMRVRKMMPATTSAAISAISQNQRTGPIPSRANLDRNGELTAVVLPCVSSRVRPLTTLSMPRVTTKSVMCSLPTR